MPLYGLAEAKHPSWFKVLQRAAWSPAPTGVPVVLVHRNQYERMLDAADVGTLLFVYPEQSYGNIPGELLRVERGWVQVDAQSGGRTGQPKPPRAPVKIKPWYTNKATLKMLLKMPYHVFAVDPHTVILPSLGLGKTHGMNTWEETVLRGDAFSLLYPVLAALAPSLPEYGKWGQVAVARRLREYETLENVEIGIMGVVLDPEMPRPPALHAKYRVLRAQEQELIWRAERRFVAGRLGLGVSLPVRRNYVQLIIQAVLLILPMVMEKLGTTVETFNRLPRIDRQRKLIAILSSRLWWMTLNPVTVVAARQVAASAKMQNVVLDLLEQHGSKAVEAAGEAARAAVEAKK